jgi:hypothetical protein
MTAVAASGFNFVSWWQSCCVRVRADRPARPRTQHGYHHDTKVKPEAATALIELLMMGRKTPETCRPTGPTTNTARLSPRDTKVKPEVATAVIELLMMGGKKPETCWAVNKPQDNKLGNCCILLVIYLNCTMMHGLTNLKFAACNLLHFLIHASDLSYLPSLGPIEENWW